MRKIAFGTGLHSTMSEITGISPQKHDKLRCNIEVDGVFFCGMTLETVMKNRLKTGSVVTAEELSRMQLESERRPRSIKRFRIFPLR